MFVASVQLPTFFLEAKFNQKTKLKQGQQNPFREIERLILKIAKSCLSHD
jgi:hypothetical protein